VIEAQCASILVPHDHRHISQKRMSGFQICRCTTAQISPFGMPDLTGAERCAIAAIGGYVRV
jgi:hypothetical protein